MLASHSFAIVGILMDLLVRRNLTVQLDLPSVEEKKKAQERLPTFHREIDMEKRGETEGRGGLFIFNHFSTLSGSHRK